MNKKTLIEPQSAQSLFIQMYFNEALLSSGTAFLVEKGDLTILITAKHNLTGRHFQTDTCLSCKGAIPNKVEVFHHVEDSLGEWSKKKYQLYVDMDNCADPVFVTHEVADVAALAIDCVGCSIYSYNVYFDPTIQITPSERVSVIGFPYGLRQGGYLALWVNGTIASEPEIDYEKMPCFLIDCRTREGQSGSPVIVYKRGMYTDRKGNVNIITANVTELLGIYTGRISEKSDLGYVWKLSSIQQLLETLVSQ